MRRFLAIFLTNFALAGCAHEKAQPRESALESADAQATYQETAGRILADFTPDGWLISKYDDGTLEHTGDSLIFTGMLLGVLSCEDVPKIEGALIGMINTLEGGFWRHPTKPDDVSQDGALGVYWGVSHMLTRCPERMVNWSEPLKKHMALGDYQLNRNSMAQIFPEYDYARDYLFYIAAGGPKPDSGRLDRLGKEVAGSAFLAKTANQTGIGSDACFRVHIGLLAIETAEIFGGRLQDGTRDLLCEEAKGMGLSTLDAYCGRWEGVNELLDTWQYDEWEYQPQRCEWESADGRAGLHTPGLGRLVGLRSKFKF